MDNKLHNELEQKKAKHLSIDSSLGVWWIKLEDGEYYQHHTPATKKMYGYSDSQTTGKKIFSDNWKKIAKQVAKLDPTFADYHKELQKKFYELVDGVCNSTTYVSPWLNEKKELIWIEDQLTVISRNEFGKPDIIIGSSFDITKTIIILNKSNSTS